MDYFQVYESRSTDCDDGYEDVIAIDSDDSDSDEDEWEEGSPGGGRGTEPPPRRMVESMRMRTRGGEKSNTQDLNLRWIFAHCPWPNPGRHGSVKHNPSPHIPIKREPLKNC